MKQAAAAVVAISRTIVLAFIEAMVLWVLGSGLDYCFYSAAVNPKGIQHTAYCALAGDSVLSLCRAYQGLPC